MERALAGRVALVTGGSRGIGKAIALELARQGALVAATATTSVGASAISEWLGEQGAGFVLRVTEPESIEQALQAITKQFGAPDILVNNAGVTRDNLMLRMKLEEWDTVIDTNLTAVFRLSQLCLRAMLKKRQGRIINIGSVVGSMGNPGQVNYAAAKAGMTGLSRSLALEVASRHITVNVIAPGFIVTDMTQGLSEDQRNAITATVPMQRLGQPQDIANAVAFLASEAASYITGQVLHVNGGMYRG